jgi:hypothetical protein
LYSSNIVGEKKLTHIRTLLTKETFLWLKRLWTVGTFEEKTGHKRFLSTMHLLYLHDYIASNMKLLSIMTNFAEECNVREEKYKK